MGLARMGCLVCAFVTKTANTASSYKRRDANSGLQARCTTMMPKAWPLALPLLSLMFVSASTRQRPCRNIAANSSSTGAGGGYPKGPQTHGRYFSYLWLPLHGANRCRPPPEPPPRSQGRTLELRTNRRATKLLGIKVDHAQEIGDHRSPAPFDGCTAASFADPLSVCGSWLCTMPGAPQSWTSWLGGTTCWPWTRSGLRSWTGSRPASRPQPGPPLVCGARACAERAVGCAACTTIAHDRRVLAANAAAAAAAAPVLHRPPPQVIDIFMCWISCCPRQLTMTTELHHQRHCL